MMLVQRELQRSFASAIFDTERNLPNDVISHAVRHPLRRFNVYRNNVTSSLIDVLEAYFPVAERLVGPPFFRAMAKVFVTTAPPTSPILSRYGAEFPTFLETFPPVQDVPYLPDVARLEWLRQRAYHAADGIPLRGEQLVAIEATRVHDLVFQFHSSCKLLASSYPVVSIWRTNAQDDVVTAIDAEADAEFALVVRPQRAVHVVPLTAGLHAFASALLEGMPLGAAAAKAFAVPGAFDVQAALATLIERGAFASVHIPNSSLSISAEAQT